MARGKRGPAMSRFCDVHPLDIADGYGIVRAILVAALIPFLRLCIFVEMETERDTRINSLENGEVMHAFC